MNIYDDLAQTLIDPDLIALYEEILTWEEAGSLPDHSRLRDFEERAGISASSSKAMMLTLASVAVYREIARRAMPMYRAMMSIEGEGIEMEWPDEHLDPEPAHEEVCERHRLLTTQRDFTRSPLCPRCEGFDLIDACDAVMRQDHGDKYRAKGGLDSADILREVRLWLGQSAFPTATVADVSRAMDELQRRTVGQ